MKYQFSFLKKSTLYYGIIRYALSTFMMSFGVMKVLGLQFNTIAGPASSYQQPLEYLTGIQLTWAFLGYSHWYQVLLGMCEVLPAILLLFRRTALTGAIFLLPMTLNVFLVNYALHLWHDTQVESLILLLFNLMIFVFEWGKIKQIATILFGKTAVYKYILLEVGAAAILILIPTVRKYNGDYGKSTQNVLTGDWYNRRPVEYTLISEKINDSLAPNHSLKSFFGAWQEYGEINDSGNNWDGYKPYTIDEHAHTVTISERRNSKSLSRGRGFYYLTGDFQYQLSDDTLVLEQKVNDSTRHRWVFKKRIMEPNKDY